MAATRGEHSIVAANGRSYKAVPDNCRCGPIEGRSEVDNLRKPGAKLNRNELHSRAFLRGKNPVGTGSSTNIVDGPY